MLAFANKTILLVLQVPDGHHRAQNVGHLKHEKPDVRTFWRCTWHSPISPFTTLLVGYSTLAREERGAEWRAGRSQTIHCQNQFHSNRTSNYPGFGFQVWDRIQLARLPALAGKDAAAPCWPSKLNLYRILPSTINGWTTPLLASWHPFKKKKENITHGPSGGGDCLNSDCTTQLSSDLPYLPSAKTDHNVQSRFE